jgi:hypothetical protein
VGCALLMVSPMVLLFTGLPAVRHALWTTSMHAASRFDDDRREGPPVISISVEPIGTLPQAGTNGELPPVILPGYLLPDDGSEESAHAGS